MLRVFFRNMSSKKLAKAAPGKVINKRIKQLKEDKIGVDAPNEVPDIEDIVTANNEVKSEFFSPLQTRRQRLKNERPLEESGVPIKARKFEVDKEGISTLKHEANEESSGFIVSTAKNKSPKNAKSKGAGVEIKIQEASPKKELSNESEDSKSVWEPENWRVILENVRRMRLNVPAPVDSMGCQACADIGADDKTQRYHKLLALMLSSQTKDEVTFEAMKRLKEKNLTPTSVVNMQASDLEKLLYPVSFYKTKAKHIQLASKILIEKYASDIPKSVKELIELPGVGPKMAHICMATAWNEITGIGVDVHVHRISNRLGWVPKETKEPEKTRVALEAWLPRDLWNEVNHLFVGFGQTICTPVKPHCGDCMNSAICPSAFKATPKKKSGTRTDDNNDDVSPAKKAKAKKKTLQD